MSTIQPKRSFPVRVCKSKWYLPLFGVFLGLLMLGTQWIGGHLDNGLVSLGIMTVTSGLVLVGGRSETVRGLRGDGRDERFRQMDIHATAFAGTATILAIIVAFLVEMARGHNGEPYIWLGVVAGLSYLVAVVFLRLRS
jgi:hypothetical protein